MLRGARKGAEAVCRLHSYPGGVCLDLLVPLRRSPCSLQEAGVRDGCPPGAPFPPPLPAPCVIGVSPRVCVSPKSRSSPPSPLLPRTVLGIVRAPPKILQHFFFPCNAVLCCQQSSPKSHGFFFPFLFFFSSPALCIILGIARGQPQNQTTFCPPVLYWAFPESPHPEQSYTPPPPSPPAPNKKIPHVIHSVVCIVLGTDRGPPTNSLFFLPVPYT